MLRAGRLSVRPDHALRCTRTAYVCCCTRGCRWGVRWDVRRNHLPFDPFSEAWTQSLAGEGVCNKRVDYATSGETRWGGLRTIVWSVEPPAAIARPSAKRPKRSFAQRQRGERRTTGSRAAALRLAVWELGGGDVRPRGEDVRASRPGGPAAAR